MPTADSWTTGVLSPEALAAHPQLTLFQKTLLTTDGTVTELLSLYTGEAIKARKLAQRLEERGQPPAFLDCPAGQPLLHRTIMLTGESGRAHLFARSCFVFGNFSPLLQHGLLHTEQPIGLLWKQERLEMYREIVERAIERCEEAAAAFGLPPDTVLLSRTYAILHGGRPLGVITEKFPASTLR